MPSSKLLKERIESIQDTMKITNAMYLISSSKLRKARKNYQNVSPTQPYARYHFPPWYPPCRNEPVHPSSTNATSKPQARLHRADGR